MYGGDEHIKPIGFEAAFTMKQGVYVSVSEISIVMTAIGVQLNAIPGAFNSIGVYSCIRVHMIVSVIKPETG